MYKMLSFWQRKLSVHLDYTMSLEEKKCEEYTQKLVKKFAEDAGAVDYLTSTDPSTKLLREERMHIVPILCKFGDNTSKEVLDRIQASLSDDLIYCRI